MDSLLTTGARSARERAYRIGSLCSALLLVCILVAVSLQWVFSVLPFGVTVGRAGYERFLAGAAIVGAAAGLTVLGLARRSQAARTGSVWLMVLLAACVTGEATLRVVDGYLISRPSGWGRFQLGSVGSISAIHYAPHALSEFGFRTYVPTGPTRTGRRILFLGDWTARGTGAESACNYPNQVEARLRSRIGDDVTVLNAGIGGYGPDDSRRLLGLLNARGYEYDAVVLHLNLADDFLDYLPGTKRTVIMGVHQRVPASRFLAWFNPTNAFLFRYPATFVTNRWHAFGPVHIDSPHRVCGSDNRPRGDSAQWRRHAASRIEGSNLLGRSSAVRTLMSDALHEIRRTAESRQIAFVVVIAPEGALSSSSLRRVMAERGVDLDGVVERYRWMVDTLVGDASVIDLIPFLADQDSAFVADGSFLTDPGNVMAAERVGDALSDLLRSSDTWPAGS